MVRLRGGMAGERIRAIWMILLGNSVNSHPDSLAHLVRSPQPLYLD